MIKIKIKAYQSSKVNLSYTVRLRCLSIPGMPVASERLISCFTSARDGLEESWKGEKKDQESRNTLMQIHTVKVICLVFKTTGYPYLTVSNHGWTCTFHEAKHLSVDLTSVSPHLAMSNWGQRVWTESGDDEIPAGIHRSVGCLPTVCFNVS